MDGQKTVAVVRAIPNPGHKRRWCGAERWIADPKRRPQQEMITKPEGGFAPKFDERGRPVWAKHALPWPDSEIKVYVVDDPAPFDPEANGGVPVEISPSTLAMLRKDPRINVQVLNAEGEDPRDGLAAKGALAEAQEKLREAERKIAAYHEREKSHEARVRAAREEERAKLAGEIAELRGKVAQHQGEIADAQPRKK